MTVYRALVTPVQGVAVSTPSDVRQMLVRVGGSVTVTSEGLDQAAVDARIAAATIDGAQIQSGTVPDAHIPAGIARDSEVAAAVAAVAPFLVPTIPGLGFAFVAVAAVDGTATSLTFITPSAGAEASGVIPAGWEEVATFPVGSIPPGTYTLVIPAGDLAGVYTVATAAIDQAWPTVDVAVGTVGIASNETGLRWLSTKTATGWGPDITALEADITALEADITALTVADVKAVNQSGLFEDYNDVDLDGLLQGIEGRFDAKRYVTSIVTPEQIAASGAGDLATLTAGPVADEDQPLDHRGQPVVKGTTVGILSTGSSSLGGAWDAEVDADTGQWTVWNYPVMSYDDGARTNALVGGSLFLALDGTRAEYIPLDGDSTPNFKQSQFIEHETVEGVWAITPGTEYVAP